jgi:hypothetical protein
MHMMTYITGRRANQNARRRVISERHAPCMETSTTQAIEAAGGNLRIAKYYTEHLDEPGVPKGLSAAALRSARLAHVVPDSTAAHRQMAVRLFMKVLDCDDIVHDIICIYGRQGGVGDGAAEGGHGIIGGGYRGFQWTEDGAALNLDVSFNLPLQAPPTFRILVMDEKLEIVHKGPAHVIPVGSTYTLLRPSIEDALQQMVGTLFNEDTYFHWTERGEPTPE